MIAKDLIYLLSTKCKPEDEIFFAVNNEIMFQFVEDEFSNVYGYTDWETGEAMGFLCIDIDKSLDLYRFDLKNSRKTCKACGVGEIKNEEK